MSTRDDRTTPATPDHPGGTEHAGASSPDRTTDAAGDGTPSGAVAADRVAHEHAAAAGAVSARAFGTDRESVVAREKEAFGGIKIGSAFFGWLTATGSAVLLSALLAGVGAAVGVATSTDLQEASDDAASQAEGVGLAGAITLLVIMFLAYCCGGYVAGRMARFNGAKQGLAVWLWAVVIAILVAVVGFAAGSQFDDLAQASLPNLPLDGEQLSTAGIATAVGVAVVSLVGAILGGLAGMRFHRKVDRAG
ncbi:MAG: hypothetical protein JWP95_2119, partial [Actinotalea sp.]|nr:hypothetical protein [Actinotalea sp.]